jgi:energy-coupling factor transporter transmembrane protein EcfT
MGMARATQKTILAILFYCCVLIFRTLTRNRSTCHNINSSKTFVNIYQIIRDSIPINFVAEIMNCARYPAKNLLRFKRAIFLFIIIIFIHQFYWETLLVHTWKSETESKSAGLVHSQTILVDLILSITCAVALRC